MGSRAGFARSAQTRWPSVTTQPGSHHRVPSWFMSPPSHRRRPRLSPASRGGVPSSSSLPCPPSWLYGNAFLDHNANGVYDEPSELGAVLAEQGATGTALAAAEGVAVDSDLTPTSSARRSSMSWPSTPRSASPGSTGGSTEGCRVEGSTRRRPGGGGSRSRHRIAAHAARGDSTKGSLAPLWQPLQTKAGTGIPATPPSRRQTSFTDGHAQRRPGPESRRHGETRRRHDRTRNSLNEGRDRNPGDTGKRDGGMVERGTRSTKAGTRVPATRTPSQWSRRNG